MYQYHHQNVSQIKHAQRFGFVCGVLPTGVHQSKAGMLVLSTAHYFRIHQRGFSLYHKRALFIAFTDSYLNNLHSLHTTLISILALPLMAVCRAAIGSTPYMFQLKLTRLMVRIHSKLLRP